MFELEGAYGRKSSWAVWSFSALPSSWSLSALAQSFSPSGVTDSDDVWLSAERRRVVAEVQPGHEPQRRGRPSATCIDEIIDILSQLSYETSAWGTHYSQSTMDDIVSRIIQHVYILNGL